MSSLVVGLHHGLLHHTDAVAVHHLLQHVEDLLGPSTFEGKNTWTHKTKAESVRKEPVYVLLQ